jgi:alpha-N-acetylglucosaminidase
MKSVLVTMLLLGNLFCFGQQNNFKGTTALIQRRIPWLSGNVVFESIPFSAARLDTFCMSTKNNRLYIKANSSAAAAMAVNQYLHNYCHQSISLYSENIKPLKKLPAIKGVFQKASIVKYRHGNYHCTLNYTQAYWGWKDWEKCIDWYALNGVNLMLTLVGNEAVEQNVLKQFGYTDKEIFDLLPGPAYTNWHWLGNTEQLGGPVTQGIVDIQIALQKKILGRLDELGIEPIMQGFCSLVPTNFKEKFPAAHITEQGKWITYKRPVFLHTTDALFQKFADKYYQEQERLFGKRKFFSCDLFHEGGVMEGIELAAAAKDIQSAMIKHNPDAQWIIQGWDDYDTTLILKKLDRPLQAMLAGLKKSNTIIWDIYGENKSMWKRRKGFDGLPFMWGTVTYFGGRCGLTSKLDRYVSAVNEAWDTYPGQLISIGTNPESLENNPVWYDFVYDLAWRGVTPFNTEQWLANYSQYRYGEKDSQINKAWDIFHKTVFSSYPDNHEGAPESIFCAKPGLNLKSSWCCGTIHNNKFYDTALYRDGVTNFVSVAEKYNNNQNYKYDLIDFTRQYLSDYGNRSYFNFTKAYENKDTASFRFHSALFLQQLLMMDSLCNTADASRLDTWIKKAERIYPGDTVQLKSCKELITYWGLDDNGKITDITDYAQKQWAGLLKDYYYKRWEAFIGMLTNRLHNKPAVEPNMDKITINWVNDVNYKPAEKRGIAAAIAKQILSGKW